MKNDATRAGHASTPLRLLAVLVGGMLTVQACTSGSHPAPSAGSAPPVTVTAAPATTTPATTTPPTTTIATPRSTPRPTAVEVAGSTPTGDLAFLGPLHEVRVGEITMAYRQFGAGPDLLMIPSTGGMDLWPGSTLAELSRRYRVTIFDNRGMVRTTDTGGPISYDDLADDDAGLIDALELQRPAVFGWSTGGEVGLVLASRHPNALSALAVTGATAPGTSATKPSPDLVACMAADVPTCDLLPLMFTATPAGQDAQSRFITTYVALAPPSPAPGTAARYQQAAERYWSADVPDLGAVTVPVLVMNGGLDQLVPTANAHAIAQQIGDHARLEIDPGTLHGWFIEQPDRFLALLDGFLGRRPVLWLDEARHAYGPPNGFVDDYVDHFPADPQDRGAGVLGLVGAHGVMTYGGALQGTSQYVLGISEHPAGFGAEGSAGTSLAVFSGTVPGCGTGTAVLATDLRSQANLDGKGAWRVLEGYGTGDLATMTGWGTGTSRNKLESGSGVLHGTGTCDGSRDAPVPASPSVGTPVDFTLSWTAAEMVEDPGGTAFRGTGIDPATGSLGLVHGHGTVHLAGGLAGTGRRLWLAVEHPAGWMVSAGTRVELVQFRGSVAGCGEGTMLLRLTASYGPGTARPSDLLEAANRWAVVEGFGTGGLAKATGGGDGVSHDSADLGNASLRGRITCGS